MQNSVLLFPKRPLSSPCTIYPRWPSFIYSFTQQMLTEHLPCVRDCLGTRVLLVFLVSLIFMPFPFTLFWRSQSLVTEFRQVFLWQPGSGGSVWILRIPQHDAFIRQTFLLLIWPPLIDLLLFSRRVFCHFSPPHQRLPSSNLARCGPGKK